MDLQVQILETATVARNDAVHFSRLTLANLDFVEQACQGRQLGDRKDSVHLVTQIVNSLLGLVVFTCERELVRSTLAITLAALADRGWPKWVFELEASDQQTLGELIYHIRNAAAHARLAFSSDSPVPSAVLISIEDARPGAKSVYWRASITAAELLRFSRLFGKYVDEILG